MIRAACDDFVVVRHRIIPAVHPGAIHRIVYDATIDDAVDVAIRLSNKSQALQKQFRGMVIGTGILGGFAFTAIWISYLTAPARFDIASAAAGGLVFGVVFALVFRRFFVRETRKQQRKIVAEHFNGNPSVPCELELRADGIWVRQAGIEMTFPWTLCTGVRETADDIEINFTAGMCVVRDRHFASIVERQSFLDAARRLAGT